MLDPQGLDPQGLDPQPCHGQAARAGGAGRQGLRGSPGQGTPPSRLPPGLAAPLGRSKGVRVCAQRLVQLLGCGVGGDRSHRPARHHSHHTKPTGEGPGTSPVLGLLSPMCQLSSGIEPPPSALGRGKRQ